MAKKGDNAKDPHRKMREDLMEVPAFRSFIVSLMVKGRYLKRQGEFDRDYERGKRDSLVGIVEEFVLGTNDGAKLVAEYIDFVKTDKKEY